MKLSEAFDIIQRKAEEPQGYRVHFEHVEGGVLRSDFFPDRDETPLKCEKEAWLLARQFAEATEGRCVNIYVINAHDFTPVKDYARWIIRNRRHTS